MLCVAPYLLDVAICEEFSASPLHQPALVDGEEVDPSEATAVGLSHDDQTQSLILPSGNGEDQGPVVNAGPLAPPQNCSVVSLSSRPPPIA